MRTMGFKQIQLTRRRIMTDPYGTIMVCGDYEGNTEAIANALNLLGLNLDGVEFCANEERVALEDYHVRSPTVFPEQDVIRFDDDRRVYAASCEPTLAITMTSGRTGHWIKMRRSLAPFSGSESSIHTRSWADFITTTSGFRFSVHTGRVAR
jgi:hypothetical protein